VTDYLPPVEQQQGAMLADILRRLNNAQQRLDSLPVQTGAWTPYTPSWTSSGTAPSVGAGTLTGSYSKTGRTVTVEIRMYGGSGTSFGTGVYSFSLPFAALVAGAPSGAFVHSGVWVCTNSGSAYFLVGATISQSAPSVVQGVVNGTANQLGATAPATWNANSSFVCTITYESTT
jgi:hypothetical protein